MRPWQATALFLLFWSLCYDSTTGNLEVFCLTSGRKVEFKPHSTGSSPNVLVILNGSSLDCMCMKNSSVLPYSISWTSNRKHLKQLVVNKTAIRLTLPAVGWAWNGSILDCKLLNLNQTAGSIQFRIIVGAKPGPPQNVKHDAFYQGLRVNWTAASFTGNLFPLKYTVRLTLTEFQDIISQNCRNFPVTCLREPDENGYQEHFLHIPGKDYSCFVRLDQLLDDQKYSFCIYSPKTYKIWVTAENAVGNSNSSDVQEIKKDDLKYANSPIHAPNDVKTADITHNGFKVSFEKGKFWRVEDGPYGDLYRTKLIILDDKKIVKKFYGTDEVRDEAKFITVQDLEPWTLYRVCLQVQIESKVYKSFHTAYSKPECLSVRTKQDAPNVAPTITSCNRSAMATNNSEVPPVNVSWNIPPNGWNSPWLEGFQLLYLRRDEVPEGQKVHTVKMDNRSNHFLLQVPLGEKWDVWIKGCNAKGCSRTSHPCHILPLGFPPRPDFGSNNKTDIIASACVAVAVVILIGIAIYMKFIRQRSQYPTIPGHIIECTVPYPYNTAYEDLQEEPPYDLVGIPDNLQLAEHFTGERETRNEL